MHSPKVRCIRGEERGEIAKAEDSGKGLDEPLLLRMLRGNRLLQTHAVSKDSTANWIQFPEAIWIPSSF